MAELVERIVMGNKPFHGIDPDAGDRTGRFMAQPGETIRVSVACAAAFPHRLGNPEVVAAQQKALEAQQKAEEEAQKEVEAASRTRSASSAQAGASKGQGSGQKYLVLCK